MKRVATIASVGRPVDTFGTPQRILKYGAPMLMAVALGAGSLGSTASAGSPFEQLAGTRSSKGKVTFEGGNTEALACTAYYISRDAGAGPGLAIRCASASYKTEIAPCERENIRRMGRAQLQCDGCGLGRGQL